ncbi:hypothetical protein P4H61_24285 [Paenibacillus peoriae]|uniref:hypothetical protein n=1 Tax=Paenibacillus peoriae TaxID=59893 RepID=UPI00026C6231|nr:hypothetical protein [Paenibacillus peoriae]MEC0184599.1 hypothetical protein [Paenibacillus peoriae]
METALAIIILFLLIPAIVLVAIVSLVFKKDKAKVTYVLSGVTFAAIILAIINMIATGSINNDSIIIILLIIVSMIILFRINSVRKRKN